MRSAYIDNYIILLDGSLWKISQTLNTHKMSVDKEQG